MDITSKYHCRLTPTTMFGIIPKTWQVIHKPIIRDWSPGISELDDAIEAGRKGVV